jgi:hypothetical protein
MRAELKAEVSRQEIAQRAPLRTYHVPERGRLTQNPRLRNSRRTRRGSKTPSSRLMLLRPVSQYLYDL